MHTIGVLLKTGLFGYYTCLDFFLGVQSVMINWSSAYINTPCSSKILNSLIRDLKFAQCKTSTLS
ncbi:hypothetical protein BpHYR1_038760 [Brachionus plicatilis]|uniref:Uncharacterized protein n=1 Tax=Brachionus plicatilis TaxID=10195 RepID=A0A3M7PY68_BRAPC|nr:hypothetical protein BpHYR1_038760 [Brachionus plicatilis]